MLCEDFWPRKSYFASSKKFRIWQYDAVITNYKRRNTKNDSKSNNHISSNILRSLTKSVSQKTKIVNSILAPVIPKPKVAICCLALIFYNENLFLELEENIKPQAFQNLATFVNFRGFWKLFGYLLYFLLNFAPKKVCF